MGGPKRIIRVGLTVLLGLAVLLSLWFSTLKPEVKQTLVRGLSGVTESVPQ